MTDNTKSNTKKPVLFLLPVTLGDTSPIAVMPAVNIEIARTVKFFIVENIRSARRFLKKCDSSIDIDLLHFYVLDEHTPPQDVAAMLKPMEEGHDMAVLSEAGCPAVADPGALAVAEAHRKGYLVKPLIGPSSILLSLMASGFNGQSFTFNGYLPVESDMRRKKIKEMERHIEKERQTQIFIETPYRNNRLIAELCRTLPPHFLLCIAADITGENEKILTLPIRQWAASKIDYDKIPAIFLLYSN